MPRVRLPRALRLAVASVLWCVCLPSASAPGYPVYPQPLLSPGEGFDLRPPPPLPASPPPVASVPCAPEPVGYRRRPSLPSLAPCSLHGARTLSTADLDGLLSRGPVVVLAVHRRAARPARLPSSASWTAPVRWVLDVPGTAWLANVGAAALDARALAWLREQLRSLTGGDLDHAVVVYSYAGDWLAWNAARRVVSLGYRSVGWYPGGVDAWLTVGRPVVPGAPVAGHPPWIP